MKVYGGIWRYMKVYEVYADIWRGIRRPLSPLPPLPPPLSLSLPVFSPPQFYMFWHGKIIVGLSGDEGGKGGS